MICRNCNNEIEDTSAVCPFCGEKYENDNIFHEMLTHVMEENTQSSEEIDKLKKIMHKKSANKKRNRFILVLSIIAAIVLMGAIGAFAYFYHIENADHGDNTYRASFDGAILTVLDEAGREIRKISNNNYTESIYGSNDQKISETTYSGFVSFEKANFEGGTVKTAYTFDGSSVYGYKDFSYETDERGLITRASYSSKTGETSGVYDYLYDESGRKSAEYEYQFINKKTHNYEYDSIRRVTGEQSYDETGKLVFDKQYSYKSDGTLYLSSVKEPYSSDDSGKTLEFKITKCAEDGRYTDGTITKEDGTVTGTIEYAYNDSGALASIKYFDTSKQTGWELYDYNEDGTLKKYSKKMNGVESSEWYTYTHFENGNVASVSVSKDQDSTDYIKITKYDEMGRTTEKFNAISNTKEIYSADGHITSMATLSSDGSVIKETKYEYDSYGNCISQVDTSPDGTVLDTRAYVYDGLGNLINEAGVNADILYINEYDEAKRLTAVSAYQLLKSQVFEYNELNQIVKHTTNGTAVGYEYKDGKVATKYIYDTMGATVSYIKYGYDKDGSQNSLTTFDAEGKMITKSEISYDDRKKIISLTVKNNSDDVLHELIYNYSTDKPSVSITGENRFENKTDSYEYLYAFDKNGYLTKITHNKNGKIAAEYEYTHSEIGDVLSGKVTQFLPEPSETMYDYSYENGYLSSSTVTMPDGTVKKTEYALNENNRPYQVNN